MYWSSRAKTSAWLICKARNTGQVLGARSKTGVLGSIFGQKAATDVLDLNVCLCKSVSPALLAAWLGAMHLQPAQLLLLLQFQSNDAGGLDLLGCKTERLLRQFQRCWAESSLLNADSRQFESARQRPSNCSAASTAIAAWARCAVSGR